MLTNSASSFNTSHKLQQQIIQDDEHLLASTWIPQHKASHPTLIYIGDHLLWTSKLSQGPNAGKAIGKRTSWNKQVVASRESNWKENWEITNKLLQFKLNKLELNVFESNCLFSSWNQTNNVSIIHHEHKFISFSLFMRCEISNHPKI